ncbi:D-sedoheptulose 7-phosphate isomerase [Oryzisolibacter propanilivorax]|uniref:D-sedoheptulose 7-phosphate isomerase n=1 Tax=Oryzisolibacter propanilivorax TaxID=1527607 RepID=A0A1G9SCE5_9BURK|nr:SIS domain-containing protein [Oryzisolibacter propanilivorax]SDM33051.1 D-sedoheptulose 7-phosphate isomerase [Oryzisolibacter propanilivorax]
MLEQRIQQQFIDSADLKYQSAQSLSPAIAAAAHAVVACITSGARLLACGVGPCGALAQQFAAMCVTGFERDRPELAALALVPDATWSLCSDAGLGDTRLARQVRALGQAGDVLLVLTMAGSDTALLQAVQAAHERDMTVIACYGRDGGELATQLRETDVQIAVMHERAARVREVQALVLHCLCDSVDTLLLGDQEIML